MKETQRKKLVKRGIRLLRRKGKLKSADCRNKVPDTVINTGALKPDGFLDFILNDRSGNDADAVHRESFNAM